MQKLNDIISKPEINFWVPIILIVVQGVVLFGAINTRVSLNEAKQLELQKEHEQLEARVEEYINASNSFFSQTKADNADLKVKLAEIQKDIQYIRLNLGK